MIRDYPDVVPTPLSPAQSSTSSLAPSPTASVSSFALGSPPATPTVASPGPGSLPPPPRHPPIGMQTTYTPYVPRARRGRGAAPTAATNPLSPTGQHIPIITSSTQGGVTTRHGPPANGSGALHDAGPSAALLDKVRALDNLPRLGALRTLDLKGNDLRVSLEILIRIGLSLMVFHLDRQQSGITYLAQVLKRNRTLKVLNLSENKLDVQCLVTIAEALVSYLSVMKTYSQAPRSRNITPVLRR